MDTVAIRSRLEGVRQRLTDLIDLEDLLTLLLVLATILAGLMAAYLVVAGEWLIALAMVLLIPVILMLHRVPFIALVIWLLISPFLVQTPTAAERQVYWLIHRFMPVATLGIMLILSLLRISKRHLPRLTVAEFAMIGYLGASVLSIILQSNDVTQTLIRFYDRIFIPMCLYMIIRLSAPGRRRLRALVPVAFFLVISQVAIGTLSWIAPSVLPSQWLSYVGERTTGSLQSVSVYTTTLIFGGLILFQQSLEMRSGWKRSLFVLAYLSSIYAIFISFSRASWLAGVLVLMMVFLRRPRVMLRLMLIALPIALLVTGTIFVNQLEFAGQRLYSPGSTQTALSRLPVLVAAYRMFEAKPIFGWGYDNFDRFDRTYQSRFADLVNPDEKDLTSHNTYLTILAEQGIVGLVLFLAPVVWLLYRTLKVSSRLSRGGLMGREMLYLLWLVILAYFVVNNFAPMGVVFGLGLNWITLGLIAQIIQAKSPVKGRL